MGQGKLPSRWQELGIMEIISFNEVYPNNEKMYSFVTF